MQCVNCGFENVPGMQQCVRCQSSLALAAVDVVPPRARRRRLGSRLRRVWNPVHRAMGTPVPVLHDWLSRVLPDLSAYRIPWRALARSIIPGLGHIRYSNRAFGWALLGGWLACFPLMLMTIGAGWDWTFVMLAVVIHVVAVLSFVGEQLTESYPVARGAFGILLFLGLWFGIYAPAGSLLGQFYHTFPVHGILGNSFIADGDALLYQGPWLRPDAFQRGDVVIFRIRAASAFRGVYVREGYGLDRIIGVPGDTVTIDGGKVLVNGQPAGSHEVPLGMLPAVRHEVQIGEGRYMIVPTTVPFYSHGVDASYALVNMSQVSQYDVLGRVVFRINPLLRIGRLQ